MTPKPGEVYKRNGYRFVIDSVENDTVYCGRFKDGSYIGLLYKVSIKLWRKQMAGAKPLGRKKR